MATNSQDLLNSILETIDRITFVDPAEIPNINLYMDQVTTFMDHNLRCSTRHPEADKILTKTMINNYAKNNLLPPPIKKKYSKEHILMLVFIYYFKGVLSITDIQELLRPISDTYFGATTGLTLEDIYNEVSTLKQDQVDKLKEDVRQMYATSLETFADASEDEALFLQRFAMISMLSYDVYVKKLLIEKMIDEMRGA